MYEKDDWKMIFTLVGFLCSFVVGSFICWMTIGQIILYTYLKFLGM